MDQPVIPFDNSYARLPEHFYTRMPPEPVTAPELVKVNAPLARILGLDPNVLASPEGVEWLAGNRVPAGADPIATVYAGHQFGGWSPRLGDGRAILLGEVVGTDGIRRDIQLKGSGRTPYSRGGDGRAAIGPVLREYIVSEAMHALGVSTSRSLAAVTTGQPVIRETILPGAVLTRVATSHIRVGTFQYFASQRDQEAIESLVDHAIARHDPAATDADNRFTAFLGGVVTRQAALVAHWLSLGFIHGVMNTDNCTISGETIDYGPCAFMDHYNPAQVYSSIDQFGRYAYANQPQIAHWNLVQLAQCLLPLIDDDPDRSVEIAQAEVDRFPTLFQSALSERMRAKIGLSAEVDGDRELVQALLDAMAEARADFTLTFRGLIGTLEETGGAREQFEDPTLFDAWVPTWKARLEAETGDAIAVMKAANPLYIPRNHIVEEALAAATDDSDYGPFEELVAVLEDPFDVRPGQERYTLPPEPEEVVQATFCGT